MTTQKKSGKEPTETCMKIEEINFEGHIIPREWYQTITYRTPKGKKDKADILAINILSEIIYWYRPKRIEDSTTGRIIRYERRFDADKLQRSYQALADYFGVSKRQATDACKRLRDRGLITLEFRHFPTKSGVMLSNVLFIEPVPEAVKEITFRRPCYENSEDGLRNSVTPPTKISDTYTEITTENTTEINISATAEEPSPKQMNDVPITEKSDNSTSLPACDKIHKEPTEHQKYVTAIAKAFDLNEQLMVKEDWGRMHRDAKQVIDAGFTLGDIHKGRLIWDTEFPGKTGVPPKRERDLYRCMETARKQRVERYGDG